MLKGFQDTSSQSQFKGFPNLNFQQSNSAYGYSGVSIWFDAAFGLNTQTNLGAVSRWQSRVGNAIFEQATASFQPRLVLNDANYNNFPSVEAQSNVRFLQSESGRGIKYNGNNTIVVVSKVNTSNNSNAIFGNNTSSLFGIIDGGNDAGYNGFGMVVNTSVILQGTTETSTARIKIITNTDVIVNGSVDTTGTNTKNVYDFINIFRNANSSQHNLIGTIAEIIVFNYSMTSTEAIDLSNRLNTKYAIY